MKKLEIIETIFGTCLGFFFYPANSVIVQRGKPGPDMCNSAILGLEFVVITLSCFSLAFKSNEINSSAHTNRCCSINVSVEIPY